MLSLFTKYIICVNGSIELLFPLFFIVSSIPIILSRILSLNVSMFSFVSDINDFINMIWFESIFDFSVKSFTIFSASVIFCLFASDGLVSYSCWAAVNSAVAFVISSFFVTVSDFFIVLFVV